MKTIVTGLMVAILFLGCGSKEAQDQTVEPKVVVGKSLELKLNDQFEKSHSLKAETKKVIFAFSKDVAHTCNDFFVTESPTYLSDNNTQFVADVSAAPSLIRSLFIMPGLKDFKHTVLILDDENIAAPYRAGLNVEKIIVVYVDNKSITEIKTINSLDELKKSITAK